MKHNSNLWSVGTVKKVAVFFQVAKHRTHLQSDIKTWSAAGSRP